MAEIQLKKWPRDQSIINCSLDYKKRKNWHLILVTAVIRMLIYLHIEHTTLRWGTKWLLEARKFIGGLVFINASLTYKRKSGTGHVVLIYFLQTGSYTESWIWWRCEDGRLELPKPNLKLVKRTRYQILASLELPVHEKNWRLHMNQPPTRIVSSKKENVDEWGTEEPVPFCTKITQGGTKRVTKLKFLWL